MFNIGIQFMGLVALIVGVAVGYWIWVRPRASQLNLQSTGLLMLLVLTLMGGLIGSTGWWLDEPSSFSWDLPPLASRMLASAAVAFAAANFMTLQRPTQRRVRLVLLMLVIYLLPLAAAIVLFHLNRFDPSAPITYVFFILVIGMIIAGVWYLWRTPPMLLSDQTPDSQPSSIMTRVWLIGIALVMGLWGMALFHTDSGSDLIWLWAGDLLTSRLIAVMLLTICAAALYSRRFADTARITHLVIVVYGVGVVVANLISLLSDKPLKPVYAAVFGIAALISFAMLFARRV